MSSSPIRMAFIGAGIFARDSHLPAIQALGNTFEIAAVPDAGTRVIVHLPAEPKAAMREETTIARADR